MMTKTLSVCHDIVTRTTAALYRSSPLTTAPPSLATTSQLVSTVMTIRDILRHNQTRNAGPFVVTDSTTKSVRGRTCMIAVKLQGKPTASGVCVIIVSPLCNTINFYHDNKYCALVCLHVPTCRHNRYWND